MEDPTIPSQPNEEAESFGEMLSKYQRSRAVKTEDGARQIEGTVVAVTTDAVFVDIGYKTEGMLPLAELREQVKPGDKLLVSVKGRGQEGYYELSRGKIARPTDWASLERAFNEQSTIVGRVTAVVKGGLSVDIGVRAFMPASRSGMRDAADMEKLVEQEIRCRIIKLDVADEDVVVDRRVVAEDEERAATMRRFEELKEGDVVSGEVRSLAGYGAFVDLGGVDGLLHVGEISWSRVNKPEDVLTVGQQVEVKVIKIDPERRRISLSIKQLQPHPWDTIAEKYKAGDRVRGTVTRVAEFGAFVELEPGIEGLIHVSEMSWAKKVRVAGDVVKPGDTVDAVVLGFSPAERRMSLGLKQALGDPWRDAAKKFAPGSVVEGPVTKLMNFGAFVQVAEGVEGMVHVSEISAEKRINHPQDVLKAGQVVKAQVIAIDADKRQIRLSLKRLIPTSVDEYIAEHKPGDVVTGRIMEIAGREARVELGEGLVGSCRISPKRASKEEKQKTGGADLSSLTSMLAARWKGGEGAGAAEPEEPAAGQIRSFRITRLDADNKKIELELA